MFRAFSEDEMKETMASEDFKAFLEQAEKLVNEAQVEVRQTRMTDDKIYKQLSCSKLCQKYME